MQTQTWNQFEVQLPVRAGMQQLYDAWTTQQGIEKWFLRSSIFTSPDNKQRHAEEHIQPGDNYTWMWYGYDDKVKEQRTILQANGKDLLQFEFSGDCLVTVRLKEEKGCVRVMLTQERIPADDNPATNLFVGCQIGWSFYMVNLKSIMEGGIDLRTKDVSMPKASMA